MSLISPNPFRAVVKQARTVVPLVLVYAMMVFLQGCAMQRPFHFHPSSVTRITYNPSRCKEIPGGQFKCSDVVFSVAAVEPEK